jgi:hypothetical protein
VELAYLDGHDVLLADVSPIIGAGSPGCQSW